MRWLFAGLITVIFIVSGVPGYSQARDPLAMFEGRWVMVNPPGPYVIFTRAGLGTIDAGFPAPLGQATVRRSDGESGSNLRISGRGYNCFYQVSPINSREMVWQKVGGQDICWRSAHFKKDPP
jgi:hypothetical protein